MSISTDDLQDMCEDFIADIENLEMRWTVLTNKAAGMVNGDEFLELMAEIEREVPIDLDLGSELPPSSPAVTERGEPKLGAISQQPKVDPECNMPGCNQPWLHDGPCTSKVMTAEDFASPEGEQDG